MLVIVLAVAGGLIAVIGVGLGVKRAVDLRWCEQRIWELTDLVTIYEAAKGDADAEAKLQANQGLLHQEFGYLDEKPSPTRRQMWCEEFGWSGLITVLGILLATIAGIL